MRRKRASWSTIGTALSNRQMLALREVLGCTPKEQVTVLEILASLHGLGKRMDQEVADILMRLAATTA